MLPHKLPSPKDCLQFAYDGQKVWFVRRRMSVRCTVVAAMGKTCRVVNEELRIDTWADLDELVAAS